MEDTTLGQGITYGAACFAGSMQGAGAATQHWLSISPQRWEKTGLTLGFVSFLSYHIRRKQSFDM